MDINTYRVIWYPQCPDTARREAFFRQLQTLKRWALIEVWRDEIAGQPCYVIKPQPHKTLTADQAHAWTRFHRWFNRYAG